MGFGYRVFNVTVHKNGRGDALAWDGAIRAHLGELLAELASEPHWLGTPYLRERRADLAAGTDEPGPADDDEGQPLMVFGDAVLVSDRHVHFRVWYGKVGRHTHLAGGGEPATDIRTRAALGEHRVDLILPAGDTSETALAVVEAHGNECPRQLVNLHLSARSRDRTRDADGKRKGDYHLFRFASQPDGVYLKSLIDKAETAEAIFKDLDVTARGRPGGKKVLRSLTVNLKAKGYRDKAVKHVGEWVEAALDDTQDVSTAQAVKAMEKDLGLADGIESLGWDIDDVEVVLAQKTGPPRVFAPGIMRMFFTYPVTIDHRPTDDQYYGDVVPRVQSLNTQYQFGVSTKSATGVCECLIDSTSEISSQTPPEDSASESP